jgi:hypothetical protein
MRGCSGWSSKVTWSAFALAVAVLFIVSSCGSEDSPNVPPDAGAQETATRYTRACHTSTLTPMPFCECNPVYEGLRDSSEVCSVTGCCLLTVWKIGERGCSCMPSARDWFDSAATCGQAAMIQLQLQPEDWESVFPVAECSSELLNPQ